MVAEEYDRFLTWLGLPAHLHRSPLLSFVHISFIYLARTFVIGSRYLGSDLWVRSSKAPWCFADLTDVPLADEDTNLILADNA